MEEAWEDDLRGDGEGELARPERTPERSTNSGGSIPRARRVRLPRPGGGRSPRPGGGGGLEDGMGGGVEERPGRAANLTGHTSQA